MKNVTVRDIIDNPDSYKILEQIEELNNEKDETLVRIRKNLINDLNEKYGYKYE